MLIHNVIEFCNNEYSSKKCTGCGNSKECECDCKNCLDDLHYHRNKLRIGYDCEHLLDYYVCRYSYKYCSEIVHALSQVDMSRYPYFNVLSLGCGGAPDLMALDYLNLAQPLKYKGFDINQNWKKIHEFIVRDLPSKDIEFYRNVDVLDIFKNTTITNCNIIFIEYLISFFYNSIGTQGLNNWFEQLAQNIVVNKPSDSPLLLVINDADSISIGRDHFPDFRKAIEQQGLQIINEYRMRFKSHSYYQGSNQYLSQKNFFDIPDEFRENYKVAISCESAQLILEVR